MVPNNESHDLALCRVRTLNDDARQHLGDDRTFVTQGIATLPAAEFAAIVDRVRTFDDFTPDSDPYGEHDFGTFELAGRRVFWKIDYYDLDERYGSSDPADPTVTKRFLTIMLADEY